MSSGKFVVTQHRAARDHEVERDNLGITTTPPKHPQYAVMSTRMESFREWPSYLPVSSELLAEAGLVYTGVGDSVRCYYCGGGLRSWEKGDNPWLEHAKWYPHCPHVLLVKGHGYVEKVEKGEDPDKDIVQQVEQPDIDTTVEDRLNTPAALSCIQMGYDVALVEVAIEQLLLEGNTHYRGADICGKCELMIDQGISPSSNVTDSRTMVNTSCGSITPDNKCDSGSQDNDINSEELEELLEENERLKEDKLCKICLDDVASIIFLPCGHMICCPQCAPALSKCAICRNIVKGRVKAFFA